MPARSDKLFQKRKTAKNLSRRTASIAPNRRVLIVTEGEVTEVQYFEELKRILALVNVDLDICGKECDSSPTAVVRYAIARADAEGLHSKGGYNDVYCVIDRDDHKDFHKALDQILNASKQRSAFKGERIVAVVSYPCFEYWLLLHFAFSRSPFSAANGKTAAEVVSAELKKHPPFEDYEKSLTKDMLIKLRGLTDDAIANAAKSLADAQNTGEMNPSSTVHELVAALRAL
ncbi:hypothetical protein NBRC116601_21020 [Cognatishimia sp. WU-CL00825]|uniref:RloB family protein n=1 Tax=Cognatishimia sp. WU-CL00825 TaxID=3127658 RepID=UPI0031028EAA